MRSMKAGAVETSRGPAGRARWGARAALALLVVASDACTCVVNPPERPGPSPEPGPGGALPAGCKGRDCELSTSSAALRAHCPTGSSCDVGSGNGRGIYVARESEYCFVDDGHQGSTFCPEHFVTAPGQGVLLQMRHARAPLTLLAAHVSAEVSEAGGRRPVELRELRADKTELAARYLDPATGAERVATGAALAALSFHARSQTKDVVFNFEFTIAPAPAAGGVARYAVSYQAAGSPGGPRRHCGASGSPLAASFLGGKRVDGLTAQVAEDPAATTMSCQTGAIDTCLGWGYAPWEPRANGVERGNYLFATCLQAKRAAYYVGLGDTTSYTRNGTGIYRRDPFGIHSEPQGAPDEAWASSLEAIWSPRGAECLNLDRRRRQDIDVPDRRLPRCSAPQWTPTAKIAIVAAPGAPLDP